MLLQLFPSQAPSTLPIPIWVPKHFLPGEAAICLCILQSNVLYPVFTMWVSLPQTNIEIGWLLCRASVFSPQGHPCASSCLSHGFFFPPSPWHFLSLPVRLNTSSRNTRSFHVISFRAQHWIRQFLISTQFLAGSDEVPMLILTWPAGYVQLLQCSLSLSSVIAFHALCLIPSLYIQYQFDTDRLWLAGLPHPSLPQHDLCHSVSGGRHPVTEVSLLSLIPPISNTGHLPTFPIAMKGLCLKCFSWAAQNQVLWPIKSVLIINCLMYINGCVWAERLIFVLCNSCPSVLILFTSSWCIVVIPW